MTPVKAGWARVVPVEGALPSATRGGELAETRALPREQLLGRARRRGGREPPSTRGATCTRGAGANC